MTVKTNSGEVYDLGAEAGEVNLALEIMGKEKLLEPLLAKMYEIGVKETMKKYNIEDKPKDRCYLDAVHRYIDEAKKANATTRNKKVTLDEQLTKLVKAMNLVNQAYWWFLNNDYNELAVETSMRIERDIGQLISDINGIQKLKRD